ncbi:hypothetical protein [Oceanobacillus damuensis]|nr:hypothetical protein [Oceanobacillus damuensis]
MIVDKKVVLLYHLQNRRRIARFLAMAIGIMKEAEELTNEIHDQLKV